MVKLPIWSRTLQSDHWHHYIVFITLICLVAWNDLNIIFADTPKIHSDAAQHLELGYSLATEGTFERLRVEGPNIHRTPLYPLILAATIKITGLAQYFDSEQFLKAFERTDSPFPLLLIPNVIAHLILLALSCLFVWNLTGSICTMVLTGIIIGFDSAFLTVMNVFYTETFSALLLLALGISLYGFARKPIVSSAMSGILLGLLTLMRGIDWYFIPIYFAIFAALSFKTLSIRQTAINLTLLSSLSIIIVLPWLLRNKDLTGEYYLSNRGGVVLSQRASLNDMTLKEYGAYFLYWSNSPWMQTLLFRFVDKEHYQRLGRSSASDVSLWRSTLELHKKLDPVPERAVTDSIAAGIRDRAYKNDAIERILEKPFMHLAVSLPVLAKGLPWGNPLRTTGILAMLIMSIYCLQRKHFALFLFFLPAYLSCFLYAATTHYIPRYTLPVVPFFAIAIALLTHKIAVCANRKIASE